MTTLDAPTRWAVVLIALSAMLHLAVVALAGLTGAGLHAVLHVVVYAGLIAGLTRRSRIVAWLAFFIMAVSGVVAITGIWSVGSEPAILWTTIAIVNGLATIAVFGALWRTDSASIEA